jgi:hypothetical protein
MAPPPADDAKIAEATKLAKTEPAKAESIYKEVLATSPGSNQAALQNYENALVGLGVLYRDHGRSEDLAQLVKTSRSTLSSFAKAKTAKLGMSDSCYTPFHANHGDQFVNSSTSLQRSQTPSSSRSQRPSPVSTGPIPKRDHSCARISKQDWLAFTCRNNHTMKLSL